jgi:hypothetical protein
MDAPIKDQIAGLRAQAAHFRGLAVQKRSLIRILKARPLGQRDPIAVLKAQCAASEYSQSARQYEARAKELRAQMGGVRS